MVSRFGRKIIGLLVILASASACSHSNDSLKASTVVIPASPAPLASLAQVKLPVSDYILSPEEAATLQNAVIIKANEFLERFGVKSTIRPNNVHMASDATLLDGRYSTTVSVEGAQRYGYQMDPRYIPAYDKDDERKTSGPLDPQVAKQNEILNGTDESGNRSRLQDIGGKPVPAGGCFAEGNSKVQNHEKNYWSDLIHLSSNTLDNATSRMENDSRLLEAGKKWSACMKAKGYSYAHVLDAADSVADKPQDLQIKVAVDDSKCARDVNYYGVMYALDVAYERQYIEEHQAEFTVSQDGVRKSLVTARAIVAKGE